MALGSARIREFSLRIHLPPEGLGMGSSLAGPFFFAFDVPSAGRPTGYNDGPTGGTPIRTCSWICVLIGLSGLVVTPASGQQDAAQPDQEQDAAGPAEAWPGIRLDREAGIIDLEATVVNREVEWLELLVCSPRTREHEAILTAEALPSHIHLALLTMGLEPGEPLSWERGEDGQGVIHPPTGPAVELLILLEPSPDNPDGRRVVPANEWVLDRATGEPLEDNVWLFAGSRFVEHEGREYFLADQSGTIASIVNFGDDLLTRATTTTNQNDEQAWGAVTEAIPPVGTRVILRLRPVSGSGDSPETPQASGP